ncbi:hypothetical protein IZ6_03990 [Terrihabitans soli]|uniref:DUF3551 domain-containing protein n=1 Tax=Terrihabitans soli TaxID=708113 RepID=A0A6S6QHM9_9HYPH|nr:hypothetical protein IZ6_03990 [Terrihabitans soli]
MEIDAMMKRALTLLALSAGAVMFFGPAENAQAVVYCTYVDYPANCVVRPGVVLRRAVWCTHIDYPLGCVVRPGVRLVARPVVRAVTPGVGRPGVPGNRGGPVNRPGRF